MFKNLTVYRIGPDWSATVAAMEEGLAKARFAECGATQALSAGWVPPRGHAHGALVESVGAQLLLALMVEHKLLPGAVVKRRTEELAQQVERASGRKPGKKQTKELKEQAVLELLPMAFTKRASFKVWLDPQRRLLMVDAGSATRASDVVMHLVKAFDGLSVAPLQTAQAAATAMAEWLASGEAPATFSVDRECELKSDDELKSVVRYARHRLDTDEVRQHITTGKRPTRLALTWQGRVSFVLTETGQIKKLDFLDVVFENHPGRADADAAFDADAAIATGELVQLIPDLVEALGGEQRSGDTPPLAGQLESELKAA
ncbi:recombination-associated protein RdgC [Methylibium sp.]|uniref:recombination-associated protein RdgC n=1 Tax=Methylibium sp. TaxID=2067992 RepID=UPI003D1030B8